MGLRAGAAIAAFLALAPPARAARVTLVVADEKARRAAAALAGEEVVVVAFDRAKLADPITKGRFLASLQAGSQVISATRGRACGWLAGELEGVPLRCLLPFNPGQVLDFAREARWRRIPALYSPGYEGHYGRLRGQGRGRGIELVSVLVRRPADLPARLPGALEGADALWLLDSALAEGAALEYIIEVSLSRRVPLLTSQPGLLARGAFLDAELDDQALLRHAANVATAASRGGEAAEDPPPGRLLINRVLERRWGLKVPGGAR